MAVGRCVLTLAMLCVASCAAKQGFFLRNRSTRKCIDVSGAPGVTNSANVQSWDCEFNVPNTDQIWYFDNVHRLHSKASDKCLDVSGYRSTANSANLQIYTCEVHDASRSDHRWELDYRPGTNFFQIRNMDTGKCLDVVGFSSLANGANIQQYTCEGFDVPNTDHWWEMVPEVPTNMEFFIRNRSTGKCIDVAGAPGITNGANVQSWDCELSVKNTDQIWHFDGKNRLRSKQSDKCLDVSGYRSTANSANLQIYTCEDHDASRSDHRWEFVNRPGTVFFQIRNMDTGKCLDVAGYSSYVNGANIQQYTCEGFDVPNTDHWWEIITTSEAC